MAKLNCTTGNINLVVSNLGTTHHLTYTKKLTYGKAFKRQGYTLLTTLRCQNETQGEECKSSANA